MRRSRRGKSSALEFGGSGEDSFVAVVVTKLTGALLFILLLTMVIMALLPKAVDFGRVEPQTRLSPTRRATASRCGSRHPAPYPMPWRAVPISSPSRPPGAMARPTGRSSALYPNGSPWRIRPAGSPELLPKPTEEPLALRDFRRRWDRGRQPVDPARRAASRNPWRPLGSWWKPRWHAVAWRSLAGAGLRVPGPLAGPPTRDEPPGEPRTPIPRGGRRGRRPRNRPDCRSPAVFFLPDPHPPRHALRNDRTGGLARTVSRSFDVSPLISMRYRHHLLLEAVHAQVALALPPPGLADPRQPRPAHSDPTADFFLK